MIGILSFLAWALQAFPIPEVSAAPRPSSEISKAFAFEKGAPKGAPVYRIIRTDTRTPGGSVIEIRHLTPKGEELIFEKAHVDIKGKLRHYTIRQNQLDETGQLKVDEEKVIFTYEKNEKKETSQENFQENLVASPTLIGHVQKRWKQILNGEDVSVRLAVPDRRETVGFKLFKESEQTRGELEVVVVKMKPSSIFIAALVDPIYFIFEKETARLLEMRGRLMPKRREGGQWHDHDGRIVFEDSPS